GIGCAWWSRCGPRGSATSRCSEPSRRPRGTCSCPRRSATGRTTTRRCPSAAARRSPSRSRRPATSRPCASPAGSGCWRSAPGPAIRPPCLRRSRHALRAAGVANASILLGDGTLGWSAYAPYDAIVVAAGGPDIPPPLLEQLAPGGRLLIPLGPRGGQTVTLVERAADGLAVRRTPLGTARFVPLVGEHGFDA